MNQAELPSGINLVETLDVHDYEITRIAWSSDGRFLAVPSLDQTIYILDNEKGKTNRVLFESDRVICVAWSPDGSIIASGTEDHGIRLWDVNNKQVSQIFKEHSGLIRSLAFSPDGRMLASGSEDQIVKIWDIKSGKVSRNLISHNQPITCVAWSPNGKFLATSSDDNSIRIWDPETGELLHILLGHLSFVLCVAWSPNSQLLASSSSDNTIRFWDCSNWTQIYTLEGHRRSVRFISFSFDGRLLASKSWDGTIRIWSIETRNCVSIIEEPSPISWLGGLHFNPAAHILATLGDFDTIVRIWKIDLDILLGCQQSTKSISYTSAKVVLVGESNVGKSCLAMRLAEDRYPQDCELGTTHGMKFWLLQPEQLSLIAAPLRSERRDVILWDMGGQAEYHLVHQLFLHDTTLALVFLDPTRGQIAYEDAEAWAIRLEKQLKGRKAVKLLVGSKMDTPKSLTDKEHIDRLVCDYGFAGYYETSALTGRGIPKLREAIAASLDWDSLAKTNRPELFQKIRDEIELLRKSGEVVLYLRDLNYRLREQTSSIYEEDAVQAVAEQLAAQGIIAVTHLASGEHVLILQIGEVERYAGSIIIAARGNPRGVPALDMRGLVHPNIALPGITEEDRLPRSQERIVLECVVQLFVEHGICFEHEGMIVFPTLFRQTEHVGDLEIQNSVSLYYDFSGAIDNIYASLVAWLVIGKKFGRVRLWQDLAEFEKPGKGICGIRKVERRGGFAHMDVYFQGEPPEHVKAQFISFVEEHLRLQGVDLVEHVGITCVCGYRFEEVLIRDRISKGDEDIGCPNCDRRIQLAEGTVKMRERKPELIQETWALRTEIEKKRRQTSDNVVQVFAASSKKPSYKPIHILHLSDLHFSEDTDPFARFQPLTVDIKDSNGGLGFDQLDYLVISGDLTNKATPEEFEIARQFVSCLIDEFELTAERCIIVPGNHDISWDEIVYDWKPKRIADIEKLPSSYYCQQGNGYLIRDEKRYPDRLKNFSHDFYHPLLQKEYPLAFEHQCITTLFEQIGIQFVTFNSCWQIDEWFPKRSDIHFGALARGLSHADEEINKAKDEGRLAMDASLLRIGVWHHPVTGNDKIVDDAFIEQLCKVGIRLCMHGHIHEDRPDLIGYLHPRKVHVAGAGSFGAPAEDRPESMPRLYNLLDVSRDLKSIRVYTRCQPKLGGAWRGWNNWPRRDGQSGGLPYYDIFLK